MPGPFELLIIATILFMVIGVPIIVLVLVLYLVNRSKPPANDDPRPKESHPEIGPSPPTPHAR
jgi:uncharacterized paraquat-inducible protein A